MVFRTKHDNALLMEAINMPSVSERIQMHLSHHISIFYFETTNKHKQVACVLD